MSFGRAMYFQPLTKLHKFNSRHFVLLWRIRILIVINLLLSKFSEKELHRFMELVALARYYKVGCRLPPF